MKKKLIALAFSALPIIISMPVQAGVGNCDSDAIHCAYATNQNPNNVIKFIRFTWNNKSTVMCKPLDGTLDFDAAAIKKHNVTFGPQEWKIEQCFDINCKQSIPIATDDFTLTQKFDGTEISANPPKFPFTLVADYGKNCGANESKSIF